MTYKKSIATDALKPLCDDVAEWAAGSRFRLFLVRYFKRECLAKRLRAQLKARPCVWGMGFWPDQETERIARICAENIDENFGCGSSNFIPNDAIDRISKFDPIDDLDGHEAVLAIEEAFDCVIPDEALSDCTFGEFVNAVKNAAGKKSVAEMKSASAISMETGWRPKEVLFIVVWPFAVFYAIVSAAGVLMNYCGVSGRAAGIAAIIAWIAAAVSAIRANGRDYVFTNILRFLLTAGVGIYLLHFFFPNL